MLHHPTLDQLRHLKLHGMARAFAELGDNAQAGELDHAQWLALLLDREEAERNDRRLTYRLRNARLRHPDACRDDFSVLYKRIPRMFAELEMGRADGRYPRLFRALTRANLLILDDWGPDRLNPDQRRDLMEIVEDRYNNAAILVTSQLPLAKWHDVIGEPTFADAILDRIVHNAHRIDLVGPSMRKAIAENINANAIDHTEQK